MDGSGTAVDRISSGIIGIDQYWRGVFKGGRYLVFGRNASGRNLLPMIFLSTATDRLETSLLVTRLRDVDLYIQACGVGFDAGAARESGLLRVSRIPAELEVLQADDDGLESALKALASLIVDAAAERVVIDDFSPFSRFSSFDHFRTAFIRLLDEIEHINSTVVIGMPEPANDASRRIIEMIGNHMTGSVHVHTVQHDGYAQRTLSLIPQIGHATHRTDVPWILEELVARTERVTAAEPSAQVNEHPETSTDEEQLEEAGSEVYEPQAPAIERETTPEADEIFDGPEALVPAPELTVFEESSGQIFEDREAFADELQLYFEDFESSGTPFTLVAMRMEDGSDRSTSEDFRLVTRVVEESLDREDSMLADPGTERIIIILGQDDEGAAQELFSRVKNGMRVELHDRADELMNAVSAVVVNNGRPFITAGEFLTYVLDED